MKTQSLVAADKWSASYLKKNVAFNNRATSSAGVHTGDTSSLAAPSWVPEDKTIAQFYGDSVACSNYKVSLTKHLSALLPDNSPISVLDVGAGDCLMGGFFQIYRPATKVIGVETFIRIANPPIPLLQFDGKKLPFEDKSFDVTLFSNVLHHTNNHDELLREAARVTRSKILIKDHIYKGWLGRMKLLALDILGNIRFGVVTTGDYLTLADWSALFEKLTFDEVTFYSAIPLRTGFLEHCFANDLEAIFEVTLR